MEPFADYLCTLKIVDESHKKPGIEVRVFEESKENLPRIAFAGDIIQLNRVTVFPRSSFLLRNKLLFYCVYSDAC